MLRVILCLCAASLFFAGCNLGSSSGGSSSNSSSGSSDGSSASSQGLGGLVAYDAIRVRDARTDPMKNPARAPNPLRPKPDYRFNNAIPFFPRGKGEYVSSHFGWRDLWGRLDFHCGTDVAAAVGTPIRAVTGGYVTFARSAGKNGGVVIYFGGRQYTYWHVNPGRGIKSGAYVRPGQTIGTLADWGRNTHLHYGIYLTGHNSDPNARLETNCVDPMQLARAGLF